MTKPSYEERRITKHSASPQFADSASDSESTRTAKETRPVRIQRKRSKGWKMPENAVYVGRPTIFGNPFRVGEDDNRYHARTLFSRWLHGQRGLGGGGLRRLAVLSHLPELRGKDLACWCPLNQPCHADVLLELANSAAEN